MGANDQQIDGDHYQTAKVQHWDWAQYKDYLVGAATKYLDRHKDKGGIKSVTKSMHYIQKLVERDYPEYELVFEVRPRVSTRPSPAPELTAAERMALDNAFDQQRRAEADYQNPYRFAPND